MDHFTHSLYNQIVLMLLSVLNRLCISFQSSVIIIYNLKPCYRVPFDNFVPLFGDSLRHNWCWSHSPNTTTQQILLKGFSGDGDHVHHTFQIHNISAKKAKQNSPPPVSSSIHHPPCTFYTPSSFPQHPPSSSSPLLFL